MDNTEKENIAEAYGDDIALLFSKIADSEPKNSAEKELTAYEQYGMLYDKVRKLGVEEQNRVRNDGEDYMIKDLKAALDDNPHVQALRKAKEDQAKQRADDQERFDKYVRDQEAEKEFAKSINERFGEGAYQKYFGKRANDN